MGGAFVGGVLTALVSAPRKEREDARAGRVSHYAHPTDRTRMWCGALRRDPNKPWQWGHSGIECVVCADLFRTFGMDGWLRGEAPR